jgi:hypothetical protein
MGWKRRMLTWSEVMMMKHSWLLPGADLIDGTSYLGQDIQAMS